MQAAAGDGEHDHEGHRDPGGQQHCEFPRHASTSSRQGSLKNVSFSDEEDLRSQVEKMRGYLDFYCEQVKHLKGIVEGQRETAVEPEAQKEVRKHKKLKTLKSTSKAIASANNWWARSQGIRIPYRMHSKFDNQVGASHQSIIQESRFHNKISPEQNSIPNEDSENAKKEETAGTETETARKETGGNVAVTDTDKENPSENPSDSKKEDGDENEHTDSEEDESNPLISWVTVSQNAYGAFLHVGLQSGYVRAVFLCGTMLIVSICIQIVFSIQLFLIHVPDLENSVVITQICEIPSSLQICGVMIFITLMWNNVGNMRNQSIICMFSTHHQLGDGDKIGTLDSAEDSAESKTLRSNFYLRLAIFFTAILTEILTWSAILVSGILWISSSPTIDLVIRSTVAVMFVLNVDEIVFESCCPAPIREDVGETKYRIPRVQWSNRTHVLIKHYWGIYVHLPLLVLVACGIVYGFRFGLECQSHAFFSSTYN